MINSSEFYSDRTSSDSHDKTNDMNQEFVSEDYDTSAVNMDDIRREIEQLTVTKKNPNTNNAKKAGSPGRREFPKKNFFFSMKYL
jgi:hypothetical protein